MTDPGCLWHSDEPVRPERTTVCVECGHAFTVDELRELDLRIRVEIWIANDFVGEQPTLLPEDQIFICPLCTHDF